MQKFICASSILFFLSFSSAKNTLAQDALIINPQAPAPLKKIIKYGLASFYATQFNGRKTSTGVIFRSAKLTAACNVLPLGTWVKVTNLKNRRSIIVEINDRLHKRNKRLIDLSKFGAQKLKFISRGVTRVRVEVVVKPRNK